MKEEKLFAPMSGFIGLVIVLLLIGGPAYGLIAHQMLWLIPFPIIGLICLSGFFIVNPNESAVLVFFGKYVGTTKENGFFFANPFYTKRKISLRARNLDSEQIKVNDKLGNPIMIAVVLVWKVENTYKAAFDVNDYEHFVRIQSESAVRKMAGIYAYDNLDEEHEDEITLRGGGEEVDHRLEEELRTRLAIAGINVIEARISHLAYASEIAGAMLQRQQATAVVAARRTIVEGAVGMVEMALIELSAKNIIELDDEKRAAMVSNLMVVLCSDKSAAPVINTGTLNQ